MAHPTTERTASNVRAEMGRARMSARRLSEITDIPATTLARRLRGESPFTVAELALIADALGLSLSSLLPEPVEPQVATA